MPSHTEISDDTPHVCAQRYCFFRIKDNPLPLKNQKYTN